LCVRVAGSRESTVKIADQVIYGTVLVTGDDAQRAMVVTMRIEARGGEQSARRNVVRVGDKGNAHPGTNGFTLEAQAAGVPSCSVGKDKRPSERHAKRHGQN
jgi:hypothetical protein